MCGIDERVREERHLGNGCRRHLPGVSSLVIRHSWGQLGSLRLDGERIPDWQLVTPVKSLPRLPFKFSWLCTTWPQTGHLSYAQVDKIRFIPSVCIDYMLHSRNCFGHWAWNSIQMWFLSWLPTQSMGFSHTIIHVKVCTTGYFFQREK